MFQASPLGFLWRQVVFTKSKCKTSHAPGFLMMNYIHGDEEGPEQMEEDIVTHEPPHQEVPFSSHLGIDISSSNTFVPLSPAFIPPSLSHLAFQSWEG